MIINLLNANKNAEQITKALKIGNGSKKEESISAFI